MYILARDFHYFPFSVFHQCQNKGRAALLPEPPSDTVFHQLQNLTKQNPACKYKQTAIEKRLYEAPEKAEL